MNEIKFEIFKAFALRLWMLAGRSFTAAAFLFAHSIHPHWVFIVAFCVSFPLVLIAFYRLIETVRLYFKILPDIDKLKQEEVKAENKKYLKKLTK